MTTTAATIPWHCLTPGCAEQGTTTGTEYGADKKHADEAGHSTTTTARVWGSDE